MPLAFEKVPEEFVQKAYIYDYKTPLTEVLGKVNNSGAIIVTKDKKYYGIIDDRTLARSPMTSMPKKLSAGKMAKKVPILNKETSIARAALYFYNSAAKALPFGSEDDIKGIVRREDILKALLSLHMLSGFKAVDAMSSPVIGIDTDANVAQAKSVMQQNKIHRLIVISNNKISGLVTYKGILKFVSSPTERLPERKSQFYNLSNTPVGSIATTNIYDIEQGRLLEEVARTMIEKGISSLVVTRGEKPVGIVTIRDIFELIVSESTISENNIIISGLDFYTKEYEADIKSELNDLANKINRFTKLKVAYLALNVKRMKVRNYELQGRIVLSKRGAISAVSNGYSLESALKELCDRLYKSAKEKKEIIISNRERVDYGQ